jgi:4-amino-4-deoxy-L-arabinose transferase-like glycosyltransferase
MSIRARLAHFPAGVWLAAGGAVGILLATAPRYGFHRDELYFVVAGRRLDWGYIDQPPLTPLVARISELVAGASPFTLRILPAFAVGVIALLTAAIARRLGGGHVAQVFAAFSGGWAGVVLGEGHLLSTAIFDYLFWTVALWILVRLLDDGDPRWWLGFGLTIGIGMQNKSTIVFFAVAAVMGVLATSRRRVLAGPLPWVGAGIALLIAAPNLLWQAANDWPQLDMAEALRARSDGPVAFVILQPVLLSVALAVPAAVGWWRLVRSPRLQKWRALAVTYGILFVVFLVTAGKAYYVAPMYSALFAAGAIWFAGLGRTGRRVMAGAAALGVALGMLIALPLLPRDSLSLDATGELSETVGWPELVDQVAAVRDLLPVEQRGTIAIITGNYGEAGAIDVLGPDRGLPPAVSGHNNYWLWGPPESHGPIIAVGPLEGLLRQICPTVERAAQITNPWNVDNEESGYPILLCRNPTRRLADIWDFARHYN